MALPILPIVAAVGTALQAGMGAASKKKQNETNIMLAREQMEWNERMWHMQNKYNSPSEQMRRLKEAELNPRLVYGQSSGTAAGNAGDVKGYDRAEAQSIYNGEDLLGDIVGNFHTSAQTDNVRANTEVQQQEAINKAQDSLQKEVELKQKKLKYNLDSDLYQTNVEAAQERVKELRGRAESSRIQAEVDAATKNPRIIEAIEKAKMASERTKGVALDNELKRIENELKKDGIYPSDPVWMRLLMQQGLSTYETIKRLDYKGAAKTARNKWLLNHIGIPINE